MFQFAIQTLGRTNDQNYEGNVICIHSTITAHSIKYKEKTCLYILVYNNLNIFGPTFSMAVDTFSSRGPLFPIHVIQPYPTMSNLQRLKDQSNINTTQFSGSENIKVLPCNNERLKCKQILSTWL